uniref:Uncharacterized protein n=1 Tax=Arundo donax TaxID=35708 RepID=A0A0A8ZWX2_ARUDO
MQAQCYADRGNYHGPITHIPQGMQSSANCGITSSLRTSVQFPQHKLKERPHRLKCCLACQIQS